MDGRLGQSLHNAVRLSLGMERRDRAVSLPYGRIWYSSENSPEPLPAEMPISEVFEQTKRQLLILGEPGAGKTTTMLELARELLDAAKEDNTQPIPVLVSLSSWKQPEVGIFDWLVAELKGKYGLRQDLGKAWLESGALLPLLDGLDEVTPVLQQPCAEAINTWLTGDIEKRPCGLLVCCRREEFEKIVCEKLSLQGAIYLQPLTAGQIEEYFARFELADVWQTVEDDVALRELLATPLFLSMFGLVQVQGKFDLTAWQTRETSEAKIEYLFDTYWDAAMRRELILDPIKKEQGFQSRVYGKQNLPDRTKVLTVLIFTAKSLNSESQSELAVEYMQPSWLVNEEQFLIYKLVVRIILITLAYLICIILDLAVGTGTSFILMMTIFSRIFLKRVDKIVLVEKLEPSEIVSRLTLYSRKERWSYLFALGGDMRIFAYSAAFFIYLFSKIDDYLGYMIALACMGITSNWIVTNIINYSKVKLDISEVVNSGVKISLKNIFKILPGLLLIGLVLAYSIQWRATRFVDLDPSVPWKLLIAFIICLVWNTAIEAGGRAVIQHISLRIVFWFNGYVPIRFDRLLDYCTERLLIQRIGGRYRFMHKLLQDYFAKMELD